MIKYTRPRPITLQYWRYLVDISLAELSNRTKISQQRLAAIEIFESPSKYERRTLSALTGISPETLFSEISAADFSRHLFEGSAQKAAEEASFWRSLENGA